MLVESHNPILARTWGVSEAADSIWSEITGRAPSTKPWERWFMVLHVYADESETLKSNRGAYAVGGYIATPEAWANFSEAWEKLLPLAKIGKTGRRRFKMAEMNKEIIYLPQFYQVICDYVLGAVAIVIFSDDLERAKNRIWSDNVILTFGPQDKVQILAKKIFVNQLFQLMEDPRLLIGATGPRRFYDMLVKNRDKIDIYFDNDSNAGAIREWWDDFAETKEYDPDLYGIGPQFRDDEIFLPLQAADFWASCARQATETNRKKEMSKGDFGAWKGPPAPPTLYLTTTEDDLVRYFIRSFKKTMPLANVYDTASRPRPNNAFPVSWTDNRAQRLSLLERAVRAIRRSRRG